MKGGIGLRRKLRFRYKSIKAIEKWSRRHFFNSFNTSEDLGQTNDLGPNLINSEK